MTFTEQSTDAVVGAGSDESEPLSPFLRWAGGKRWLIPTVEALIAETPIDRYHEPFLGGGSIFFALKPPGKAYLSDVNTDLIEVYRQVRDNPERVAALLAKYENTSEAYYEARDQAPSEPDERAARFIFLNHTSYNGIFRVNLRGEYNVPYGSRKHTNIPDKSRLVRTSHRLAGVELGTRDFEAALKDVTEGDLVFLDPPYTVAHNNNGFVKYNQHLFSFDDQRRLAAAVAKLRKTGARFIVTNAAHKSIDELFSPVGRKIEVSRRNSVGGRLASRGRVEEYLFTNLGEQ